MRACVGVGAVGAVGPLPAGRGSAVRLGSALTAVWESRSVSAKSLNLCKDGCEKNTKACEKVSSKRNTSRMATTLRLCRHAARRPRPHGWRLPDRPLVRRRRRVHISTRPRCSALSRARLQRRPPAAPRRGRDVRTSVQLLPVAHAAARRARVWHAPNWHARGALGHPAGVDGTGPRTVNKATETYCDNARPAPRHRDLPVSVPQGEQGGGRRRPPASARCGDSLSSSSIETSTLG